MNMSENDKDKLRAFFGGEAFQQHAPRIEETHHPLMVRTHDQGPWQITQEEAEQVLHEFAPALSVAISGNTMVIFCEAEKKQ